MAKPAPLRMRLLGITVAFDHGEEAGTLHIASDELIVWSEDDLSDFVQEGLESPFLVTDVEIDPRILRILGEVEADDY